MPKQEFISEEASTSLDKVAKNTTRENTTKDNVTKENTTKESIDSANYTSMGITVVEDSKSSVNPDTIPMSIKTGDNTEIEDMVLSNDITMRPKFLDEFVGQNDICKHLKIMIEAAKQRSQSVDHLLFAGPPGLGKTTLASIVANEMGAGFRVTSGPVLLRAGDLAALLNDLNDGDILFIDEIHRLARQVEEVLYPAMEDNQLDIMIGKGPTARSLRIELAKFTLIGATTRTGLLTSPLRDRFGHISHVDFYDLEDLMKIVLRAAKISQIEIDNKGAHEIALRSRGTPRIANRLFRRVRDFAQVKADGKITEDVATEALDMYGVDKLGLDKVDREILEVLCVRFAGQRVGLNTLAAAVSEETDTIEDVYEPFLLKLGLIDRTPRGRLATPKAFEHLGIKLSSKVGLFG